MRRAAELLTGIVLVGALSGCASGGRDTSSARSPVTTGTSSLSPERRRVVSEFFTSAPGSMLLGFLRATAPYVNGRRPARADCEHLARDVLPSIASSPEQLVRAATAVPDATLRSAMRRDVADRVLLLGACVSPSGLAENEGMDRTFSLYREHARTAARVAARFGVTW